MDIITLALIPLWLFLGGVALFFLSWLLASFLVDKSTDAMSVAGVISFMYFVACLVVLAQLDGAGPVHPVEPQEVGTPAE